MKRQVVVVDNGADTCKVGLAGQKEPIKRMPNYGIRPKREKRLYVGDQINQIIDFSSGFYRRPFEKGYVMNWELEGQIWNQMFSKSVLSIPPKGGTLLVTEPMFNPKSLQTTMDEVAFEKFEFGHYHRAPAPTWALTAHRHETDNMKFGSECAVVVDSGYSFTHIVPMFRGVPINYAVKRIDVGGKLLTNYLKEIISFRAWNMMEETHVMEDIKKKLCLVSLDFQADLKKCKTTSSFAREYVLPNGGSNVGYVKVSDNKTDDEQTLRMNNERLAVPEVLFNPSDIGLTQAGIPEAIVQAVSECHPGLQGMMYSNILLTGGNMLFQNMEERISTELRTLVPDEFPVKVQLAKDPVGCAWLGGSIIGSQEDKVARICVSRAEWQEFGPDICARKFYTN